MGDLLASGFTLKVAPAACSTNARLPSAQLPAEGLAARESLCSAPETCGDSSLPPSHCCHLSSGPLSGKMPLEGTARSRLLTSYSLQRNRRLPRSRYWKTRRRLQSLLVPPGLAEMRFHLRGTPCPSNDAPHRPPRPGRGKTSRVYLCSFAA